ncbi:LytR family transcriptional regulator [Propioniciclava coleopterorum]|uniref:LytR family transcriptional regulator n=1 Tax=Propioniciclava coleopterorum TaxID=2714937 RepID=A0A6G7Y748_9ACTN|nr:LCP family protein [Propioniciclava coleopterorum]QIK72451.1 LytR family transcriptional regulator [Propioniciclava coleopterorum]
MLDPDLEPRRVAPASEPGRSFAASLGWATAGTVLPGLGLTRTRFKKVGLAFLGIFLVLAIAGVAVTLTSPAAVLAAAASPAVLTLGALALAIFGVLWATSIAATHLALRPREPRGWQRAVGGLAVAVLSAVVLLPSIVGARTLYDTSTMLTGIFGEAAGGPSEGDDFGTAGDPWANKPRLNVLILGGDSGQNRADAVGARTDTVILASIDTRSGDTVLFSLPRQTQRIPFPQGSPLAKRWPNGFTNGMQNDAEYFLNAIYHNVPVQSPEAIPAGVEDPGAYALKEGVGAALGLPVDYYAMINMDGFIEFINALGGITVNINAPVPVGGKTTGNVPPDRWLPPGPDQRLNGMDALWFARGRYGSASGDYDRMARQRCVVQAVVKQANPTTVLANYEALSKAGRNIVATDAPTSKAPALLALSLRVKDGTMTSVSFENDKDGFSTVKPDWDAARARVLAAINPPAPEPQTSAPAPEGTPAAPATDAPSAPPTADPNAPATPASVVDECAYNPQ